MNLDLYQLPPLKGPDDNVYHGKVPPRALFLHPDAAASLLRLEKETGGWRYSDIWRSAESSLHAIETKRGALPPGYSGHGFGFCVDVDLHGVMKDLHCAYHDILDMMQKHDWYCHRRDAAGPGDMEAWHFNYLGPGKDNYLSLTNINKRSTWSAAVEKRIMEVYAKDFQLDMLSIQTKLQNLHLYSGALDGKSGPLMRQAIMAFQRAWLLDVDGQPGPRTQRTLAFVTATKNILGRPA